MALKAVYERFLALPNPLSLADDASLHYVTTLTSLTQPGPIIKHLENQNKNVVKVKAFKIISTVEGDSSIAVEVETTLEFISGGGAYLPGLENFIVDKNATIPVTHVVHFNGEQKITQIRVTWDQGSLLKQTDIIGSRGRGWPVYEGKDQIRLIAHSSNAAAAASPTLPTSPRGRATNEKGFAPRNASPNKKYIKDPHTSLDLFGPERQDENRSLTNHTMVAPRASAKPPPREMSDLFAAGHEDYEPSVKNGGSPKKSFTQSVVAPKGGGNQKFQPSRLFDEEDHIESNKGYATNPARYDHFDLGDADENDSFQHKSGGVTQNAAVPMRAKTTKHMSQWDFQDFNTPAKYAPKIRGQDVVQWGNEETHPKTPAKPAQKPRPDAESHFELEDDGTPLDRHAEPKPRKDIQNHFEFRDEATPAAQRFIGRTAAAKGLYRNVLEEDGDDTGEQGPLAPITNNAGRKNDFNNHWSMADSAPSLDRANNAKKLATSKDHKIAVQMMDSHWDTYEQSPQPTFKPVTKQHKKGLESHWGMDAEENTPVQNTGRTMAQKSQSHWDF